MKEAGPRNIRHRRPDLLARVNNVDTERVDRISADVVAVHARNQHLALVVVYEEAADHDGGCGSLVRGLMQSN